MWDAHHRLRKRARSFDPLFFDTLGRKHIAPTLANISANAVVLKPFTAIMATHGIISKSLPILTQAIQAFYQEEIEEERRKDPVVLARMNRAVKKSSKVAKTMLTEVKRKWSRWEMPRETFVA